MERVQAEENRAVADGGAVPRTGAPARWLAGYILVAAPVMAACAGVLDGPWASGFAYAVLLLGVGFICRAVLPSRPMERVQAEEDRAAADADADSHHDVASPDKVMARCGYLLVAAPMMGTFAGLLEGPWAAGFAYAALLLGVASICRAVLPLPPRPMERVQARERRAVVDDAGNHQEAAFPNAGMTWCGYLLVAAPVMGACAGLADTPGAALFGYALLLLGFAFIGLAMLPLRPMERMLEDENRPVGSGNRRGDEAVVRGAGTMAMDWTGYFFVAAPVVASWAGLVEGPAATFFAFALLLLGIAFLIMAMLAVAKPKMA
jgi:hypothetical protein